MSSSPPKSVVTTFDFSSDSLFLLWIVVIGQ